MTTTLLLILAFLLALGASAAPSLGQTSQDARVEYVVNLAQPQTQTVEITMNVRGWKGETMDVHLPVWRPGRYEVLDPAGSIRSIIARGGDGKPLAIEKFAKSSWRVTTRNSSVVRVTYTLYANAINNRTRHVDDTHAFLSGSSVFLFVHELRNNPIELAVKAPDGWKIASGLEPAPGVPGVLLSPDYDTLVDSPLEIGLHDTYVYEVDGVRHEIVFWGGSPKDPAPFLRDFALITKAQKDIFGKFPHSRYVFLTHIGPGMRGGTEHVNSTVIQARPAILNDAAAYRGFLGLVSHEFFHTWNVKQFRPEGLKPYDYMKENYTKLLWVAEGTTNYFDTLVLTRCGLTSPDDFLSLLATTLKTELSRPGREVQSLEASSFDAWIKFNKNSPDSINSTVNFYTRGEMINFVLDAEVRRLTSNAKSLDDFVRTLYERFPLAGRASYTTSDVLTILKELSGADFTEFHARFIAGTEDPDVDAALATYGLELLRADAPTEKDPEAGTCGYVGLDLRSEGEEMVVTAVRTDGSAYLAGVNADDKITAVNGTKMNADAFARLLAGADAESDMVLTIDRHEQARTITVRAERRPSGDWKIIRSPGATDAQKAAYSKWLRAEWPAPQPTAPSSPAADPAPDTRPSRF